jgi:lysozyme
MRPSINCLEIIKEFEGFSAAPYLCPANVPTIGYGSTFYKNGKKVKISDPKITIGEATEILEAVVDSFALQIDKIITAKINQNQFDALVSFSYNIGVSAFKNSTLLRKLNLGENNSVIVSEINKWNRANGNVLAGLTRRRQAESKLFTK